MKERPILFSAPMVRAILEGRKNITRRIITEAYKSRRKDGAKLVPELLQRIGVGAACPYGQPGDRLWVREKFSHYGNTSTGSNPVVANVKYAADDARMDRGSWPDFDSAPSRECWRDGKSPWTPSIHMPRWASRITLEVTGIRVERVQEITKAEAAAEGFQETMCQVRNRAGEPYEGRPLPAREQFARLGDVLNGPRGYAWSSNPWVWVVSFKNIVQGENHG